jgi:hypothetical protein
VKNGVARPRPYHQLTVTWLGTVNAPNRCSAWTSAPHGT